MRGRSRTRWGLAAGVGVFAIVAIIGAIRLADAAIPSSSGDPSSTAVASASPAAGGLEGPPAVVAYYDVVDTDSHALYAMRLDGRSTPVALAERPSIGDTEWEVEPLGRASLFIRRVAAGIDVEGVTAGGASRGWTTILPIRLPSEGGVWSADAGLWAATGTWPEDDDADPQRWRIVVVDLATGGARSATIPDGLWLQGFDDHGRVILSERHVGETGWTEGWTFWAFDPATESLARAAGQPAAPARSTFSEVVDPARSIALVRGRPLDDGEGPPLESVDLLTGARRPIGRQAIDPRWVGISGDGRSFVVFSQDASDVTAVDVIARDGTPGAGWSGSVGGLAGAPVMTTSARYIGWSSWAEGSVLSVLDTMTEHAIEIPLGGPIVSADMDAVVDAPNAMPLAVAPVAPSPAPSYAPGASAIPGAPVLAGSSIEAGSDSRTIRVSTYRPAVGGGLALVAEMPPIVLAGPGGEFAATVALVPRPGHDEIWILIDDEGRTQTWRWTPGGGRELVDLPDGFPRHYWRPAWSPTGDRLALDTEVVEGDDVRRSVAIVNVPAGTYVLHDVPPLFGGVIRWAADGSQVIASHGTCTEGCGFRYSQHLIVDPDSGAIRETEVGERVELDAFWIYPEGPDTVIMSSIEHEDRDDIRLRWPRASGPASEWRVGSAPDRHDLLATRTVDDIESIALIRDPLASARVGVADVMLDPLASLPRGLSLARLDPSLRWALAFDRAGVEHLVDLSTGLSWEVGDHRDRTLDWLEP